MVGCATSRGRADITRVAAPVLGRHIARGGSRGRPTRVTRNLFGTYQVCYTGKVDAVMQALADPSRRTVLEILRDHEATAGELAHALPIARPGVSRHLKVLREAGLVDVRQEAQRRIYCLRPEALIEVDEWLESYRGLWRHRLDALHTEITRGKKVVR